MIGTLLIWGVVGLLLGIVYVTVIPWVSAQLIGDDAIERVSSWYVWLAQTSIGKSALIIRPGSVDLVSKKYDPDQKADKDTAGGEPRHHHDSFGGLRSIANKPFGLGLHDMNEYVTPLLSEIGDKAKELHEREELGSEIDSEDLEMQDGIPITGTAAISDLRKARHLPTGNADPEDGHRSYKKTVISQEKFHEKMTFGQTMILIGSLLASMGLAWLLASQGGSSADVSGTTISMLLLFAIPAGGWLGAIGLSALLVLAVPLIALFTHGTIAAGIVLIVSIAVAAGYVIGIALFGPSLPGAIGQPLAAINWTLAQLCVGRGVLVERDTGQYEHHQLVRNEDGDTDWKCKLNNGEWIGVNGSVGDMVRFAWAPLAITAEKSSENMTAITDESLTPDLATDGGEIKPNSTRRGFDPVFDVEKAEAEWTVTLPQLWKWCEGSAESEAVREGRDTALTKRGGRQQMSYVIYIGLIVFSMIGGGLIGLIAGGAIL